MPQNKIQLSRLQNFGQLSLSNERSDSRIKPNKIPDALEKLSRLMENSENISISLAMLLETNCELNTASS